MKTEKGARVQFPVARAATREKVTSLRLGPRERAQTRTLGTTSSVRRKARTVKIEKGARAQSLPSLVRCRGGRRKRVGQPAVAAVVAGHSLAWHGPEGLADIALRTELKRQGGRLNDHLGLV